VAEVRKSFSLANDKFFLSYIESSSIMISFNQSYNFTDFLKAGNTKVIPIDQDNEKVFLYYGNYSKTGSLTNNFIPVVVINSTTGKTAWIADFTRSGWNNVNDDHKQLLNSLILSISNKKSKELTSGTLGIGQITSYVNVINYDMFEIYKLNLGVEYPF
jgi:hypothetical protein